VPTDHPERPTKPKPTDTSDEADASPTDTAPPAAETTKPPSSWLPSFFPTFGVSAATQIWIYGSLVLIILFCSGLGVYLYLARRKRLANDSRNNYEFDVLVDEEAEGLTSGEGTRGRRKGRRAGELYDAFAAGSDEEDLGGGGESENEGEDEGNGYRDEGPGEEKHVIGGDESDEEGEQQPTR
jgi:kexin